MLKKHEIRSELIKMRKNLNEIFITSSERLALSRIRSVINHYERALGRKLNIMSYMSYKNEFSTVLTNELLRSLGHNLVFPYIDDDFVITAYNASSEKDMRISPLGIKEPDPAICKAADPRDIDIVIMPGVAFDFHGNRIGFGKGCYDRFLAGTKPVLIALAFDFQVFADIPADPFDIPCNYIITEVRTIDCSAE